MNTIDIDDTRRILLRCVKTYEDKLNGRQFFIAYRDREKQSLEYCEVLFQEKNFQHLTGLALVDENGNEKIHNSENFYRKCIEQKIGKNELKYKEDGTTILKLSILPSVMEFAKLSRMIGVPNSKYSTINVGIMAGGVTCCIGLRYDEELKCFVPVSAISEDIRKTCSSTYQILFILERYYPDDLPYKTIRHVAKGVNIEKIRLPDNISRKISINNSD